MKKSRSEIKNSILSSLLEKPLSTQQISEKVGSNWLTIKDSIEELIEEGTVKCLLSTEKIKIFSSSDYPVFYGIPLPKKTQEDTLFILSEIVKIWKNKKQDLPLNTTLQKIAVKVIKECNLDLPILPLHYGYVSALAVKPAEQLDKQYNFLDIKKKKIILDFIKQEVPQHENNASKEEDKQYNELNLPLLPFFKIRKEIINQFKCNCVIEGEKINTKEIEDFLLTFSLEFPNDNLEIYEIFRKYLSSCIILLNSEKVSESILDIKETFDQLWDLITSYLYLREIKRFVQTEDLAVYDLLTTSYINSKTFSVTERISNLESSAENVNYEELTHSEDEESKNIRKIFSESFGGKE